MKNHYDKLYYNWQKRLEVFGAQIDLWKFQEYAHKNDIVMDFGCGGGSIISSLPSKKRYGIEINPYAICDAKNKGVVIFNKISQIPRGLKFDLIISHHALEHVENPYMVITMLKKFLKKGGLTVWVVPIDDWRIQRHYNPKDIHKHLYTWNPQLLGNLFSHAGYTIKHVEIITHAWIPFSQIFFNILPKNVYFFLCKIWSVLTLNRQIRIVAVKD